jgi:hypothetical protein
MSVTESAGRLPAGTVTLDLDAAGALIFELLDPDDVTRAIVRPWKVARRWKRQGIPMTEIGIRAHIEAWRRSRTRACETCGDEFSIRSTLASYCSNACRQRAYRSRRAVNAP